MAAKVLSWLLAAWILVLATGAQSESPLPSLPEPFESPQETSDLKINAIPAEARRELLARWLDSPDAAARARAARLALANFDLPLLDRLSDALQAEKDKDAKSSLKEAVEKLRLYAKIVLPGDELAALEPIDADIPTLIEPLGFGPVDLRLEAFDAQGLPLAGARCLAYSLEYCLRVPASQFAVTDEQGAANLQLARGTWAIVLFSDPEWQKIHPDRAVFLKASPVELNRRQETLRLAPDSEIQVSFVDEAGSPLSADAIHAVDPALGAQIPFPSLGTAQGRLAMETAAGTALDILAQGRAANGDAWTCFASGAAAPAKMDWRPMGPQAARIDLRPPTLLSEIPSIKLAFTRYRHDPTQVEIGDLRPGMAVFLTPGKIELNYAVSCAIATYDYSPRQYDLRSGATLSLAMDSPTTASVFHQHYPAFYGSVKNVLAAGLIAKDANGHLLSKVLRPSGAPALISLAARDGDRPVGMAISDRGRFMEKMAHDVAASALPRLEYEIAAPLGPAIPKTLPGVDWTTVETRHFTIHAPPMLMDRVALLSEGVERLYDELRKMKGGAPSWQRTGLFFRTIMPPTSGGRSTAQGVLLPFAYLLTDRWLDIESIQKLPHELEHKFGFGHEDFMGVWANALYGAMGKNETPVIKPGPPPNAATQEGLLALLRGEPGANPGVAQWAMFRHGDIGPFREYQGIKQEWTAILQSQGFTDEETYCAIFSEFSQRDLAPLYLALGAIIRPDRYPQARDLAARLRRGEARESRRGADGEAQPLKKLDTAIAQAREKGGAEGAAILGEAADAWIRELPLNRTRCKQFMRLGAVYMELGAEEQACEAFRNVQREAMLVGRQYVNLCRRLALIGLTGAPPGLGHM